MPQNRKRRSLRHRAAAYEAQLPAPGLVRPPDAGLYVQAQGADPYDVRSEETSYMIEPEPIPVSFAPAAEHPRRRAGFGPYHALGLVCLLALAAMVVFVVRAASSRFEFESRRALMGQDIISEGVTVDGLPVGGMTREQAARLLRGAEEEVFLNIQIDGAVFPLTSRDISYGRGIDEALDAAYAVGRQGFVWMIGSDRTPFDIRWEHARHIAATGMALTTRPAYADEALRSFSDRLAAAVSREAVSAQLASFDFAARTFGLTRDEPGISLDAQAVYTALKEALSGGRVQGDIVLRTEPVMPAVTSVELQNSLRLISSFSTRTTSDALRNENIALASAAIHGLTIMPGESFSFNEMVGRRTAERGYRMAPAIAGGQTVDEIGGGVCQVSSTLFNAAAMADMAIIMREPHAWPSNYVDMGLDATVNWPNLDFAFRNDTDSPVFIVSHFADRTLTVELYGQRSDPSLSVALQTELIATTRPPDEPEYRLNTNLAPGSYQEIKKARTGYQVDTYRVYLREGQVYRREKLFTSQYPMIRQLIEYH